MKYQSLGPLAVIAAALLWSLDGLLRRSLYSLPASVVVFWEHVLGLVVILAIVLPSLKRFKEYTKKQWISLAIVSFLSGALGTFLYTSALAQVSYIPFSVVVLLQQLQPIFAVSAACILLREPLTKRFIFLAALALAVLFVLFFIFKGQTGKTTISLTRVGDEAGYQADKALSEFDDLGIFKPCTPNQKRCRAADSLECQSDGKWKATKCPNGCDTTKGECK